MFRLRAVCVSLVLIVAACSSSAKSSATTTTVPVVQSTAAAPTTTAPPATIAATPSSSAAPFTPKDSCSIVTPQDVAGVFGGTVAAGVLNPDDGSCEYDISGTTTGTPGVDAQVSVAYGQEDYTTYDQAKAVAPTAVTIDGLGDQAWYLDLGHQLHVETAGTELLISGILLPGDAAAAQAEVVALAKVVLAKLG